MTASATPAQNAQLSRIAQCNASSNGYYQQCSATLPSTGLYLFNVFRNGPSRASSARSTEPCFCSLAVNGTIVDSANCACWSICKWLPAGTKVVLEGFIEVDSRDNSSAYREIMQIL